MIDTLLALPLAPDPDGSFVNTAGIITFLTRFIAPIFLGFLGLIFLARAKGGEVSKVLTSSGIVLVGLAFIGGAALLPLIGDDIIGLFISGK